MKVNDIDVILTRKDAQKIMRIFEQHRIRFIRCSPNDYSMIIKKGKLKVELDEVGTGFEVFTEKNLSKQRFNRIDFYGIKARMITLKQLEEMYPIAYAQAVKTKKKVGRRIKHLEKFLGKKLL